MRVAYFASHPIQYQAPLLRLISHHVQLRVMYLCDFSVNNYRDAGFDQDIKWDVPLLEGLDYTFVPVIGSRSQFNVFNPMFVNIKRVLSREKLDAVWMQGYGSISHLRVILAAKSLGLKVLMWGDSSSIRSPHSNLKATVKRKFLTKIFSLCDAFLCIGTRNREYYRMYGVPDNKMFHMPFAVDNEFFQDRIAQARADRAAFRETLGISPDRPVILYAGKFTEVKHAEDLLDAYIALSTDGREEPNPYLVYVGDGPERAKVESKAKTSGWNSILFMGFQNQTQLPAFYDLCDVFVLPSTYEAWGLVVNEVMNAGKPVIATDHVGCQPDLIRDGENGIVVPARNVPALTDALRAITADAQLAQRMGQLSFDIIRQWSFNEDIHGLKAAVQSALGHGGC